jgi:hypothetical protein
MQNQMIHVIVIGSLRFVHFVPKFSAAFIICFREIFAEMTIQQNGRETYSNLLFLWPVLEEENGGHVRETIIEAILIETGVGIVTGTAACGLAWVIAMRVQ